MSTTTDQEVAVLRNQMDEVRIMVKILDGRTNTIEKVIAIIQENLTYIKTGQDKLNSNVSKALWALGTVFIVGFGSWIMGGFEMISLQPMGEFFRLSDVV